MEKTDEFGGRLLTLLQQASISQAELAKRLGLSKGLISQWVSGTKECPRQRVEEIASLLGADIGYLSGKSYSAVEVPPFNASWYFRPTIDGGRDYGNPNVFATPSDVATLVREVGQNSLDQALHRRVHLRFELIKLTRGSPEFVRFFEALAFPDLESHLRAASRTRSRLGRKLKAGLSRITTEPEAYVLRIEDFRCTGLYGPEWSENEEVNPFAALVRNNLDSSKTSDTSGGSYGLGKAPLWRSSDIATVLFSSRVGKYREEQRHLLRVSGKAEATWHELRGRAFAGPGWLAATEAESGSSAWVPPESVIPLFLDRRDLPADVPESEATGTSILIVGFRPTEAEGALDPGIILQQIRTAAAMNFWPAIVSDKLRVSTCLAIDGKRRTEEEVEPDATAAKPFVEAMRSSMTGDTTPQPEPGETASTTVQLTVPATLPSAEAVPPNSPSVETSCTLLVRLARPEDLGTGCDSHVAEVRGQGMVVRYWPRAQILVGARPFHAILLAGTAIGDADPDHAAERFLRLAEPPAHDRWEYREDLRDNYARGSGARLRELGEDVTKQLLPLIRPEADSEQEEPEALKRVLALNIPKRDPVPATLRGITTTFVDGCWQIQGEVKILDRRADLRANLELSLRPESGAILRVPWADFAILKVNRGHAIHEGNGAVGVAPKTTSFVFEGRSTPGPDGLELERCRAQVVLRAEQVPPGSSPAHAGE